MLTARLSATHAPLVNATACRIGPPSFGPRDSAHLGFVHSQLPLAQLAPATLLEDGVLQCVAPPAARAGGVANLTLRFGRSHPSQGRFYGDAAQVTDRVRPCGMGSIFSCGGEEEEGYTHAASAHCEWLCPVLDGVGRLTNGQLNAAAACSECLTLGSAPARTPCRASSARAWRLWAARYSQGRGQATGIPATASGAQASAS